MNTTNLSLGNLFQQLGLESSDKAIEEFLRKQAPLPKQLPLHQATLWNHSQALFLQEALQEDSDWSLVVDQLNARLR